MLCGGFVEGRVDHAWFDDGGLVVRVQVKDAVHPFQGQDDAVPARVRAAGNARARSAGHDGDAVSGTQPDHSLHLRHRTSKDHRFGELEIQDGSLIHGIPRQQCRLSADLPCAEGAHQLFNQAAHAASRRRRSPQSRAITGTGSRFATGCKRFQHYGLPASYASVAILKFWWKRLQFAVP